MKDHTVNVKTGATAALTLLLALPALGAQALSVRGHQTVTASAAQAQQQCFREMYRDSNAYAQCIRNLRNAANRSPLEKLGIEYFGFVGALSYMRVGHLNSEQIAAEFLRDYRSLQRQLKIGDDSLCSTIAGNCQVRIAQMRQMEAAPPKPVSMAVRCERGVCRLMPTQVGVKSGD